MRMVCIQHVAFEDAGRIAEWAMDRSHDFDVVLALTEQFPEPSRFDLLVVMGGPMNIYQEREHPWLVAEKTFIGRAIAEGKRVFGVCLGAQLVADVLGAPTTRNAEPEIGWFPVERLAAVAPLDVLPETFEALHWHGDTFAIPSGATRVARSEACENQAFVAAGGRVVGMQFHLETTPAGLTRMIEHCPDEFVAAPWVRQPGELLGAEASFDESTRLLYALLDRWAEQ